MWIFRKKFRSLEKRIADLERRVRSQQKEIISYRKAHSVSTLHMDHDVWLENRRKGIGGSDAGSICGLNPYSSAISVFQDKTQPLTEKPDNESMKQGRD